MDMATPLVSNAAGGPEPLLRSYTAESYLPRKSAKGQNFKSSRQDFSYLAALLQVGFEPTAAQTNGGKQFSSRSVSDQSDREV